MAAVYIREQGTTISKRGDRLVAVRKGQTILERPVFNIDSIAVFGNVQISTQAAAMLMERGTDIGYFTYSGKYIGHIRG